MARVFPNAVTSRTRLEDFVRAGIDRRVPVMGADKKPIEIGKGKRKRIQTRIESTDPKGRIADLHALRTTLGTQLARAGVAPQEAQKIMRLSDYRTTLKLYTVLGLHDSAGAIAKLRSIKDPGWESAKATGSDGRGVDATPSNLQRESQHVRRDSVRVGDTGRVERHAGKNPGSLALPQEKRPNREFSRGKDEMERAER